MSRIRDSHAARFNYDLEAICLDFREQQQASARKFVSYPARRIEPQKRTEVAEAPKASDG